MLLLRWLDESMEKFTLKTVWETVRLSGESMTCLSVVLIGFWSSCKIHTSVLRLHVTSFHYKTVSLIMYDKIIHYHAYFIIFVQKEKNTLHIRFDLVIAEHLNIVTSSCPPSHLSKISTKLFFLQSIRLQINASHFRHIHISNCCQLFRLHQRLLVLEQFLIEVNYKHKSQATESCWWNNWIFTLFFSRFPSSKSKISPSSIHFQAGRYSKKAVSPKIGVK